MASLETAESYAAWLDFGTPLMTTRHQVEHARAMANPNIQQLVQFFNQKQPSYPDQRAHHPYYALPSEDLVASRVGGKEHQRRVDMQSTITQRFLKHFSGVVELKMMQGFAGKGAECIDSSQQWKKLLFVVSVPEDMMEDGSVIGLRPTSRPPIWVPVKDLPNNAQHDQRNFPIQEVVADLVKKPAQMKLTWRQGSPPSLKLHQHQR